MQCMTASKVLVALIGKDCIRETVIKRRQNIHIYLLTLHPTFIFHLFKGGLERYTFQANQVNSNVATIRNTFLR